jgi:hypothetical protein
LDFNFLDKQMKLRWERKSAKASVGEVLAYAKADVVVKLRALFHLGSFT